MKQLKICFVSSEVVPFAKTGGLADVAGALPVALKELDQDIRVMMTKYKSINERKFVLREVIRLKEVNFKMGDVSLIAAGKTAFLPNSKVHVYFLHIPEYFDRKDFYVDSKTGICLIIGQIDNLVKGQAGSALQNMNLMHGLDETLGLYHPPMVP